MPDPRPPRVEVVRARGALGPEDAATLAEGLAAMLASGADWVAVDLTGATGVDVPALIDAARRDGVVVCGAPDAVTRELDAAGVVATPRLLDVRVAARAGAGDGLKRRFELLALPRP